MREDTQYIRIGIKPLKNGNWEMKNTFEIKYFTWWVWQKIRQSRKVYGNYTN